MGKQRKFNKQAQDKFTLPEFRQLPFFGGSYCTQRKHRVARPISTKEPMHLVLRSSQAKGEYSFFRVKNRKAISAILVKLARKWGIKVISFANVGNHLHLLIVVRNRHAYKPFICALTGGIATLVTKGEELATKFWDYRPYSRIISGLRSYLTMRDYIEINQYEGGGTSRELAVLLVKGDTIVDSG